MYLLNLLQDLLDFEEEDDNEEEEDDDEVCFLHNFSLPVFIMYFGLVTTTKQCFYLCYGIEHMHSLFKSFFYLFILSQLQ